MELVSGRSPRCDTIARGVFDTELKRRRSSILWEAYAVLLVIGLQLQLYSRFCIAGSALQLVQLQPQDCRHRLSSSCRLCSSLLQPTKTRNTEIEGTYPRYPYCKKTVRVTTLNRSKLCLFIDADRHEKSQTQKSMTNLVHHCTTRFIDFKAQFETKTGTQSTDTRHFGCLTNRGSFSELASSLQPQATPRPTLHHLGTPHVNSAS